METILRQIQDWEKDKEFPIIAIDGRCAAGKSTLASYIKKEFSCNVIHMDDFFLHARNQTSERLAEPGGNIDYERFQKEVITSLKTGEDFSYKKFSCIRQDYCGEEIIKGNCMTVVEGAYACHTIFGKYYDYSIFLDIDSEEQYRRLKGRNGMKVKQFVEKWIPLEERYIEYFDIENVADVTFRL